MRAFSLNDDTVLTIKIKEYIIIIEILFSHDGIYTFLLLLTVL